MSEVIIPGHDPQTDNFSKNNKSDLVKYISENVIGKNTSFDSPYGRRQVVYCDNIATGRSIKFIEDYISNEVLANYGSTHTTSTVTALQTTLYRQEARDIIRNAVRATEHDEVIFVGSGATGAINKLINGLHLPCPPVVFVCPFTHHSSLLPWRELGAEVVRLSESAEGNIDLEVLEEMLIKYKDCDGPKIGCFTAASNVTGIIVQDVRITKLLHNYGFLSFWDYATAAPYVDIQMNPFCIDDPNGDAYKDAIFFSLHKFIGGVQSPGILIAKSKLFQNWYPEQCGGGTVVFVSRKSHQYLQNIEEREEGGTPAIVESIRGGMTMQLKMAVTPAYIMERNKNLNRKLAKFCKNIPELIPLGNISAENRLPILSFLVLHRKSGWFLHHNFISAVLNDVFGIQARGGCACAGPYAQDLLGMNDSLAMKYVDVLKSEAHNPSMEQTQVPDNEEHGQLEVLKPGFVRLNLSFTADDKKIDFILEALKLTCQNGWKLLPQYSYNRNTGGWKHKNNILFKKRQWLNDISYSSGNFDYIKPKIEPEKPPSFEDVLNLSRKIFDVAKKESDKFTYQDDTALLQGETKTLRWFLLPSEARKYQSSGLLTGLVTKSHIKGPFIPCNYPLNESVMKKREVIVWSKSNNVENIYSFRNYFNDKRSENKICYNLSKLSRRDKTNRKIRKQISKSLTQLKRLELSTSSGIYISDTEEESSSGHGSLQSQYSVNMLGNPRYTTSEDCSTDDDQRKNMMQNRGKTRNIGGALTENKNYSKNTYNTKILGHKNKKCPANCECLTPEKYPTAQQNKKICINDMPKSYIENDNQDNLMNRQSNNTKCQISDQHTYQSKERVGHSCRLPIVLPFNLHEADTYRNNNHKIKQLDINKDVKWHVPPKNIFNSTVRAITQFSMIHNKDKILVCLSGGKDSLSLLHTLRQYRFYARSQRIQFDLGVVIVDTVSATYDPRPLVPYIESLGIPYFFETQEISPHAHATKDFNSKCRFCSKIKFEIINATARREGYNVLAFGHHLDDLVQSFMMSTMYNSRLETMRARYTQQEGDLRVIRPLSFVREKELQNFADSVRLPIITENCPACLEAPKERHHVKQMLEQQEVLFPKLFTSLQSALIPMMGNSTTVVGRKINSTEFLNTVGCNTVHANDVETEDYTKNKQKVSFLDYSTRL